MCSAPPPSDAHHCIGLEFGCGMGKKSSHFSTIPLCKSHHQWGTEAIHQMGTKHWQEKYGYQRDLLKKTITKLYADKDDKPDEAGAILEEWPM